MKTKALWFAGLLAVLTGAGAYGVVSAKDDARIDCPGKIVCPITGELICSDECPVGEHTDGTSPVEALPACCQAEQ